MCYRRGGSEPPLQTVDAQMPFFESEMLLMYHVIASTLLYIVDIDTLYGIGGEGFLHVLASGASVLIWASRLPPTARVPPSLAVAVVAG